MPVVELLANHNCHNFYYFSLFSNINSILERGILSKNTIEHLGLQYASFANEEVQSKRHIIKVVTMGDISYSIHDFVPVYLTPKTPTLYATREFKEQIFMCVIDTSILRYVNISYLFTDGNAASGATKIYDNPEDIEQISWDVIHADYWNDFPDGRRKRCAEFLLKPSIMLDYIKKIVVCNDDAKNILELTISELNRNKCNLCGVAVTAESSCFF